MPCTTGSYANWNNANPNSSSVLIQVESSMTKMQPLVPRPLLCQSSGDCSIQHWVLVSWVGRCLLVWLQRPCPLLRNCMFEVTDSKSAELLVDSSFCFNFALAQLRNSCMVKRAQYHSIWPKTKRFSDAVHYEKILACFPLSRKESAHRYLKAFAIPKPSIQISLTILVLPNHLS